MKLGIMQPYFLPYIGYFQLIASVDQFIIYDNIKYTKRGWINRNRMLKNGSDVMFTLPLKKASDSLSVVERELSPDFERIKLLNQFRNAYGRAPQFDSVYPMLEKIILYEHENLFQYIHHSVIRLCSYLDITTEIKKSSGIKIDHKSKGQHKVLALCKSVGAKTYINTIGGVELYDKDIFQIQGLDLQFIKTLPCEYAQFGATFVPWLSIIDVIMFNTQETVHTLVNENYELI